MDKLLKKDHFIFGIFILFGTLLRLWTACSGVDTIYPDEHFQVIEPANWVVFGHGWKSWEWYYGTRSWVVPGLYIPLLYILKLIGGSGGPIVIWLCRIWTVAFSSIALWRFNV